MGWLTLSCDIGTNNHEQIVILTLSLGTGGGERVAVELANKLSNIMMLVSFFPEGVRYEYDGSHVLLSNLRKGTFKRICITPFLTLKYIRLMREKRPAIVLIIATATNIFNIILGKLMRYTPVISAHTMPTYYNSFLMKILKISGFHLAKITGTHIIAVSQTVKNELIKIYKIPNSQISVIYNPYDVEKINALSQEPVTDIFYDNIATIISVGNLIPIKGHNHLIRVFSKIRREISCRLLICGAGPEEIKLKNLVSELNLTDDVVFLGWQNNPYKYMSKSTVFVLSSLSEALPNVLIEAMASGCPVIATNCSGGIQEILGSNGEWGIISSKMSELSDKPSDNLDEEELELARDIKSLLENEILRINLKENGKERATFFLYGEEYCLI